MATRLKTVNFAFDALASVTNNTLTNFSQITIYIPESSPSFKSVVAKVTYDDIVTATGGTQTTKSVGLRLGAAAYTTVSNTNTMTNTGESISAVLVQQFTSHFTTNWTGTSMTCDVQVQINQSTGTTLGMVNVCCELEITYEYDDTSTTHIKTVYIPLDAPTGVTSAGATTYGTVPALDTYLPETSKTIRNTYLVAFWNRNLGTGTGDGTITFTISGSRTTGNYEGALASDRFFKYIWKCDGAFATNSSHNFQINHTTTAVMAHPIVYLVVTYEFNASTTTSVMNSVCLPVQIPSPIDGTTSSDYSRGERELWIEEPATITTERVAFCLFYNTNAPIAGQNARIGTGSFVSYTDAGSVFCGGNCLMVRNDSAFTLARGRNYLNFDFYRTDTADFGSNLSGFFIVNYTSGKSAQGVGAHNHTVRQYISTFGTAAAPLLTKTGDIGLAIPETDYFINAVGFELIFINNSANTTSALSFGALRLSTGSEGGPVWEDIYTDLVMTDSELGVYQSYCQARSLFRRWAGEPDLTRMDIESARPYRVITSNASNTANAWNYVGFMVTYHTITFTVGGDITGSSGGTVEIALHRTASGEKVRSTSRSGNGAYSITWYDNTENVYAVARESGTLLGRSDDGLATGSP